MTVKVLRKELIDKLKKIQDDNVSIAGIAINRKTLLEVLKLQNQENTDVLSIDYGNLSWEYNYRMSGNYDNTYKFNYEPEIKEPEPCIQICCDHTTMRFFNRPKEPKYYGEPKITALNLVGLTEYNETKQTGIPIDSQLLLRALNFVLPAMAIDGSRPVLNSVYFNSNKQSLNLVTADGFRLAVATLEVKNFPNILVVYESVIKLHKFLKSMKPTGKGKSKEYPECYVSKTKGGLKISCNDDSVELIERLGTFPNYPQLIPEYGTHIEFIPSEMKQAIKALKHIADDGTGIIRLEFHKGYSKENPGRIVVKSRSEDLAESSVECRAMVFGDCKIAVNNKYFMDFLKQCDKVNTVDMFLTTPSSPIVCYNGEYFMQVLMPMYVQW